LFGSKVSAKGCLRLQYSVRKRRHNAIKKLSLADV
jgi:hypothetical protein